MPIRHRGSVDAYYARRRGEQAADDVDQCGLARTRRADDAERLPGSDRHADPGYGRVHGVGVPEFDVVADLDPRWSCRPVFGVAWGSTGIGRLELPHAHAVQLFGDDGEASFPLAHTADGEAGGRRSGQQPEAGGEHTARPATAWSPWSRICTVAMIPNPIKKVPSMKQRQSPAEQQPPFECLLERGVFP